MAVLSFNPKTKKVKRDSDTFLRLIGQCVTRWAFIDRALYDICQTALGAQPYLTAIVYYRYLTIGQKLSLTDELIRARLKDNPFLSKWTAIRDEINRLSPVRNAMAHNPMTLRGGTKKAGKREVAHYAFTIEPEGRNPKARGRVGISIKDLRAHSSKAEKLFASMRAFGRDFAALKLNR